MKARLPLILLIAAVLAGCAGQSPRERDTEAYELYRDFAGAPIDELPSSASSMAGVRLARTYSPSRPGCATRT